MTGPFRFAVVMMLLAAAAGCGGSSDGRIAPGPTATSSRARLTIADGPGLRFRSSDGTPVDVFGTALLAPTSPTSFGGVFEGTLFDLAPAPSCSTTRQAIEMRRR